MSSEGRTDAYCLSVFYASPCLPGRKKALDSKWPGCSTASALVSTIRARNYSGVWIHPCMVFPYPEPSIKLKTIHRVHALEWMPLEMKISGFQCPRAHRNHDDVLLQTCVSRTLFQKWMGTVWQCILQKIVHMDIHMILRHNCCSNFSTLYSTNMKHLAICKAHPITDLVTSTFPGLSLSLPASITGRLRDQAISSVRPGHIISIRGSLLCWSIIFWLT